MHKHVLKALLPCYAYPYGLLNYIDNYTYMVSMYAFRLVLGVHMLHVRRGMVAVKYKTLILLRASFLVASS